MFPLIMEDVPIFFRKIEYIWLLLLLWWVEYTELMTWWFWFLWEILGFIFLFFSVRATPLLMWSPQKKYPFCNNKIYSTYYLSNHWSNWISQYVGALKFEMLEIYRIHDTCVSWKQIYKLIVKSTNFHKVLVNVMNNNI